MNFTSDGRERYDNTIGGEHFAPVYRMSGKQFLGVRAGTPCIYYGIINPTLGVKHSLNVLEIEIDLNAVEWNDLNTTNFTLNKLLPLRHCYIACSSLLQNSYQTSDVHRYKCSFKAVYTTMQIPITLLE